MDRGEIRVSQYPRKKDPTSLWITELFTGMKSLRGGIALLLKPKGSFQSNLSNYSNLIQRIIIDKRKQAAGICIVYLH